MSYTIDLTSTNSYNETLTLSGSGDIILDVNSNQIYRIDVDYSDSYVDLYPNNNWDDFSYYYSDENSDYSYILFADTNEYDINYYTDDSSDIDVTFNIETVDKSNDDYADFMSNAYELNLDENNQVTIDGNIDGIDRDFFKINLDANKMYDISVSTQNVDNPLDDSMVYVYDANGNQVAMDDDGGEGLDSDLVFQPTESGEYYIEVRPFSYGEDGNYQLSISEVNITDDAPNTISENDPIIEVGSPITGSINYSSDEDYYRFDTEDGKYYSLTISPANENDYNSFYADIYNQNGDWIYTDYSWNDNSVTIGFEGDGNTYYIDVEGWETGEYTLTLNEEEISSDGNDSPSEAVQLSENEVENGTIDSIFDEDYYAINVTAGQSYVIDVYTNSGYTWADIVDSEDNYIFDGVEYNYSYDYNDNEMIFTPTESGTYYIRIDGDSGSNYTVSYFENSDDYSNTIDGDNIGKINFDNNNASITGRLETDYDTDVFRLDASSDNIYDITLTSNNGADGYIYVVDSNGNYVYTDYVYNYDYSTLDEEIFQPTNDGTYYIEVVGFESGTYTLNITKSSNIDDHPNSVNADFSDNDILSNDVTTQTGTIDSNVDSDYFELNLTAGQTYEIDLSNEGNSGWGYLDIVDSNGNYVWDNVYWNYNGNYDDSLYFTPTDDETYYVRVDGSQGYEYQVSVNSITNSDDYGNSINSNNIGKLDENGVSGNIDYSYDDDVFEIDTQAGNTYQIIISSNNDVWGDVLDSNGYYLDWYDISYDWEYNSETNQYENILTFTADSNVYYLDVTGWESNSNYDITLRNISTDNNDNEGNNIDTAAEAVEGENSGSIDYYGDVDYFAVNLEEGNIYTINLSGLDYGYLDIVDSNDNYLWENVYWNFNPDYNDSLTITPSESGTYYVIVHGDMGDYSLNISKEEIQQDDYGNSFDDAQIIDSNQISGNLTQFDYDMFEYNFDANNTYTITLTPDSDNLSLYLDLYDSEEDYIWNYNYSWNNDGSVTITFTPSESGEYYLGVSGYGTGNYTLSIDESNVTTNDVSADTSTTAQITLTDNSGNYNGELEYYGDEDWIKVNLDKGVYEIDLTSADFDTVIDGVYDSEGNYISNTYDDDGGEGLNSRVFLDVEESGDYYIAVRAFGDYGIGDYSVSISEQTDNEADNQNTTAVAQIGNPYQGNIDYGYDIDWIKITGLTSGQTYTVNMTGDTLSDTVIDGIYDNNLNLIPNTYNDDYGYTLNSQVTFTATSDTVYVEVSGYGDNTGSYTLSVTPSTDTTTNNDNNDSFDTAENINVGDVIDASISPENDVDYYKVDLVAGNEYEFDVLGYSSGEGTLTDSTLTLYDANGNIIDYNDDYNGLDSTIIFTPESDGTYYLAVESFANNYEGSYQLAAYQLNINTQIQTINTENTQNSTTIMIYIDADNNLESYALSDLEEMIEGNLPDNVNVTFLLDRADGYDSSFGDWSDAKYGLITGGSNYDSLSDIPMQDIGEVNMGDSQTLTDFINWSSNIAPADNYALVIWDHGGINVDGNISGVAYDEDSADYLTLDEIHQALSQTSVVQNDKLGVLGFDACLEATTDTFDTLKDDTDYIVASQATEPGDGWDYENWFNLINTSNNDGSLTSEEIAQDAVESYGNYYQDYFMQATLSTIDTSKMEQFNTDFKSFNDALVSLDDNTKNQIKAIFNSDVTKFEDEYFDLGDFINELANNNISITDSNGNDLVAQLQTDISNLVVEEQNNIEVSGVNDNDVTGINVYYPGYNDSEYLSNDFAQNVDLDHLYDLLLS